MADAGVISVLIQARDQASAQLQKIEANMGKLSSSVMKHRRQIGMAATAMGGAVVGFGALSVKAASDVEESINAVNVIFGTGAASIVKFGETASRSAGLSQSSFNQLAATTGALLNDVGLPMEEVSQLTQNLTVRAADMASVMNTSVEDALSAVGQALRGETEAIRRYAGDVTEATLEQFRLSEGIQKSVKEMTEQEKRVLRVGLIMSQTSKFAGDFANTQESLANQMRIAKAEMANASATIGTALLPMMTELINTVTPLITKMSTWMKENPELTSTLVKVGAAVGAILLVVGPLLMILPALAAGFTLVMASIFPITATILAISVAVAAAIIIWRNWGKETNFFIDVLKKVLWPITLIIGAIKNWDKIITTVKDNIRKFVVNIIDMGKKFLETIQAMLKFVPGMEDIKRSIDSGIGKLDDMEGAMHRWANAGGAAMEDMGDDFAGVEAASEQMAAGIKTNTDKVQTSFTETGNTMFAVTEEVTAAMRGWGFEVDISTGIVEEMAVKMARATRAAADAFEEAGDVAMTAAQKIAEAERIKTGEVEAALEKRTSALTVNAAIDRFLSNQLIENMEGVHNARVTLTDRQISEIERGNRETARLVAEREKIEKESLARQVAEYEKSFKAQESIRLGAAAEDAARTQKQQTPQFRNMKAQQDALDKAQEALRVAEKRWSNQQERLEIIRANAPSGPGSRTAGHPEDQLRKDYWWANTKPNMNALRDIGIDVNRAKENVEILSNNIARNVIPEVVRTGYEIWFKEQEATWTAERAKVGSFANGGISGGGLAMVGERGPEIVSLPGGSRVHPSGTGPGSNQFHFHGAVYGLEDLRRVVVEAVRDHALSGGFRGVFGEA